MAPATDVGQRRTDADIFAHARLALDQNLAIPATVRVHVDDGVVWLTGTVQQAAERTEAETVVRQVAGVQRIVNRITVFERASEVGLEPPASRRRP